MHDLSSPFFLFLDKKNHTFSSIDEVNNPDRNNFVWVTWYQLSVLLRYGKSFPFVCAKVKKLTWTTSKHINFVKVILYSSSLIILNSIFGLIILNSRLVDAKILLITWINFDELNTYLNWGIAIVHAMHIKRYHFPIYKMYLVNMQTLSALPNFYESVICLY